MAGTDRQTALAGAGGDRALVLGHVDGERAADRHRRGPGAREAIEDDVDVVLVEAARRVEERVLGVQHAPGSEPDVAHARAPAGQAQLGLGADADHADARDVALEQRVHRLRRRIGDELDALAVVAELGEQRVQRASDPRADAVRRAVAGRHDGVGVQARAGAR